MPTQGDGDGISKTDAKAPSLFLTWARTCIFNITVVYCDRWPNGGLCSMAEKTTLLPILNATAPVGFREKLRQHGLGDLRRREVTTLQINVGKLCNQACHHCHVEAGPKRTEIMPADVADRVLTLLAATPSI